MLLLGQENVLALDPTWVLGPKTILVSFLSGYPPVGKPAVPAGHLGGPLERGHLTEEFPFTYPVHSHVPLHVPSHVHLHVPSPVHLPVPSRVYLPVHSHENLHVYVHVGVRANVHGYVQYM